MSSNFEYIVVRFRNSCERIQMSVLYRVGRQHLFLFPEFLSSCCSLTTYTYVHVLSYFNVRADWSHIHPI